MGKKGSFLFMLFFLFAFAAGGAKQTEFYKQLKGAVKKINNAIVLTKLAIGKDPRALDLPDRYMSLAELFVEKAKYLYYMEQEEMVANPEDEIDQTFANEQRKQAISLYQLILKNFSRFPRRDRVLILMANEYSEIGDRDKMIQTFKRLLKEYPNTPFKKEGNLVLGDYYYDKHEITMAMEYYEKVIRGKMAPITHLARYKLAWCYISREKWKIAQELFEKVLTSKFEIKGDSPFIKRSVDVKGEALIDSVLCYTNLKKTKAEDAPAYYFRLAPSRAMYIKVLDKLANRYFTGGEYSNAVIIYRKLITITNNVEKTLLYTSRIWKLLKHLKGTGGVGTEATLLSKHLLRYKHTWRLPQKDRKKFVVDYEMYMRHISTLADKEYHGLKGFKPRKASGRKIHGKRTRNASGQIAGAYRAYLQSFPDQKRYYQIRKNYSQILFDRKDWLESGKVFEEISNTDSSIKARKNSLRTALFCYDELLKKENEKKSSLYDKVWARAGIKDLSAKYLKYYPGSKKAPEINFNIARLTFEQGAQEEGVGMLMAFMKKHPGSKFVAQAGHQILDYYNLRTDYGTLVKKAKEILKIPGIKDEKFRAQVKDISESAIKAEVAEYTEDLSTAETEEEFFVVADKFEGTAIGAESLYNAFNVARLKKNHYLILAASQKMLKEYPKYRHIKVVRMALADTYLQNLQFVRACEAIEDVAKRYPKDKNINKLLIDAANIYSILGENERANGVYRKLLSRKAPNSTDILLKTGNNYYDARAYGQALKYYQQYNQRLNKMESNFKIGRTYRAMGNTRGMISSYKVVISKCGPRCRRSPELREMAAEAQFYLMRGRFQNYLKRRINNRKLDSSVNSMTAEFSTLEKLYGQVVSLQDPTYAVAALHNMGRVFEKMADFLDGAKAPKGYDKAQRKEFAKLMSTKVKALETEAKKLYKTCRQKSYDFNLFTEHAMACYRRSEGKNYTIKERYPAMRTRRSFRGKSIHVKLLKKPFDVNLMQDLAEMYFDGEDYHMAKLICMKILERKNDDDVRAILGRAYLEMGDEQKASGIFQQVLRSSSGHKDARKGLRVLYQKYGNPKYKSY